MNESVKEILDHNRILIEQIKEKNEVIFRYREAIELLDRTWEESYATDTNSYEDGYLDGLSTAIDIFDGALEDENE